MRDYEIKKLAEKLFFLLNEAKNPVIITGAGVSTIPPSNLFTFRGDSGIKAAFSLEELFKLSTFVGTHKKYDWYYQEFCKCALPLLKDISKAAPNVVHNTLARMQQRIPGMIIITQNIDQLHTRALAALCQKSSRSNNIIEVHGSVIEKWSCMKCDCHYSHEEMVKILEKKNGCLCLCGGKIRPGFVLYDEPVREAKRVENVLAAADRVVVLGSSLQVDPIREYVIQAAKRPGCKVCIVNQGETGVDKYLFGVNHLRVDLPIETVFAYAPKEALTGVAQRGVCTGGILQSITKLEICAYKRRHRGEIRKYRCKKYSLLYATLDNILASLDRMRKKQNLILVYAFIAGEEYGRSFRKVVLF